MDCLWQESMSAIQPMLYAERHRDEKLRPGTFSLEDFTLTGMAKAARRAERLAKELEKPEAIWDKVSSLMASLGG